MYCLLGVVFATAILFLPSLAWPDRFFFYAICYQGTEEEKHYIEDGDRADDDDVDCTLTKNVCWLFLLDIPLYLVKYEYNYYVVCSETSLASTGCAKTYRHYI